MAAPTFVIRPASRCLRSEARRANSRAWPTYRTLTSTASRQNEPTTETTSSAIPPQFAALDPNTVSSHREERLLLHHHHKHPIGSRRRRAALQSNDNVPFEQLPYQCFQEARKVLAADRETKLTEITEMRKRIATWQKVPAEEMGGDHVKKGRLVRMLKYLEELKILADINDPVIRKRFEDGMGDMTRPIYRHLALKKYQSHALPLFLQRISQHHLVPDLLPHLSPTADVSLGFGRRNVAPGDFVDSRVSEIPPRLRVQVFDKGPRLVTVAVVDADVPDEARDSFSSRCHFLGANIPISPSETSVALSKLGKAAHVVLPWLAPFAQKGAPYHRLAVFVLQQDSGALDLAALREKNGTRDRWGLRGFLQGKDLTPIGVHLFRAKWDEGTDGVVKRAGIEGQDIEYVRKKPEKGLYKKKDGARYR